MNYWLVKFAPFRYSWQKILLHGKFEIYSVRNPQARNNLKAMQLNDEALFYHSQEGNSIMGKMKVIAIAHQDPTTDDPKWLSVTFEPVETFEKEIETLVQKCLDAKGQNVQQWEQEIDAIVAKLYGLSDEEMQIIRGDTD